MKQGWQAEIKSKLGARSCERAMLSLYCTYRVGGPAQMLAFPESAEELRFLRDLCKAYEVQMTMLGLGSNLLVSDGGVEGLVCSTRGMRRIEVEGRMVSAQAGAALDDVVAAAASAGLGGMEKMSGIPGSVGGAAWMNAGAFGQETFDKLYDLEVMDASGRISRIAKSALKPGYRKVVGLEGLLVLSVRWQLDAAPSEHLLQIRSDILRQRADKQPLEFPSAGSVFKRPPGDFASRLIDVCGLKGASVGGAQVSEKHAGFIVNKGGASAADIYALIRKVISKVKAETGVSLELEQITLGKFEDGEPQ